MPSQDSSSQRLEGDCWAGLNKPYSGAGRRKAYIPRIEGPRIKFDVSSNPDWPVAVCSLLAPGDSRRDGGSLGLELSREMRSATG